MSSIYLDHNATTPPLPEVVETVARISREAFANPGSRHAGGRVARRVLDEAREIIGQVLDAAPSEIVFTSGGTEANNLALFGFARGRSGTFAAMEGEHPSIEEPLKELEARGWRRCTIPMSPEGLPAVAAEMLSPPDGPSATIGFATMMLAHNETGVIREVGPWGTECLGGRIPFHVDAVQAAGKVDVDFRASGATTMSIAAHKFGGPRGIGVLLVRTGSRLPAMAFGGHQESGMRPGTEVTSLAAGMAKSLELWQLDRDDRTRRLGALRDRFEAGVLAAVPGSFVHAAGAPRLPNTSNIAFPGCDGDALLVALDLAGVCASLGSACASGSSEPAPILLAMGCSESVARSSLRFSVGWTNTAEEIDDSVRRIAQVVARLTGL
ncbi:Cysteine desulfurase [Caulifigura coniformis]|uniref:Cysteine desulfurase n=1 Tax=Caulifigura coniformis TaxID=2527983 RepID=A0A517SDB0_9PLAN|nr:cysteine desulfurase family protein [Caulifigura coniformis]QDT54106.1 Cysteine desulfurase [Caulifigura coniformis]